MENSLKPDPIHHSSMLSTNRGGRPPGTPNRATADAKAAIALFVGDNAHRLQEWLDMIAHGTKITDDKGNEKTIHPDPEKAFNLFMKVIEYHIPKLVRSDVESIHKHEHKVSIQIEHSTPEAAADYYRSLCVQ